MAQKGMVCVFRLLMYYSYGDDCLRLMWQRIIEYARMRNKQIKNIKKTGETEEVSKRHYLLRYFDDTELDKFNFASVSS